MLMKFALLQQTNGVADSWIDLHFHGKRILQFFESFGQYPSLYESLSTTHEWILHRVEMDLRRFTSIGSND